MKILYWQGCFSRTRNPEIVEANIELVKKLGFEVVKLENEGCCGDPLLLAGFMENAKVNAEKTAKTINETGVDLVVTGCPGCYHTFKEYEELGVKIPEIKHITQIVAENLDKLKFKVKDKEKIVYHDPCELGRWCGVYDEPRKVLNVVAEVVEPLLTKEATRCCGGGGSLLQVKADLSIRVAETRIERDIEPTGVKKIVTACPACYSTLRLGAGKRWIATGRKKGERIEVFDFAPYILSKLEG